MSPQEELKLICDDKIKESNLSDLYQKRLNQELYEIGIQEEWSYFLNLYHENKRFSKNENNLLVPYLLGLVQDFDITQDFVTTMGEFPDIDIDYLKEVRDYLKNTWAAEHFGKENICSIGTYGTMGIKSSILDMAKIYGYDKNEIQAITVKMEDKDDDGKILEWDKALELYPDFKNYCDTHEEVAAAAKILLDRYRSSGVHAGGLIIANCSISDFVPLEVRSVKKDNPFGSIVSAWTEGQATQDLQPVGLIKFDLLVVASLEQIALAKKFVKERYNLKTLCAYEGGKDWSDISYLNDPQSIEMANNADLKAVFQFDSEGIRKLVKKGGVTSFDELPAYSSLYRPSAMQVGLHEAYVRRKNGDEQYSIHPILEPVLGKTYSVMVYQEQVMQVLNIVGDIPLIYCEKIRKAISKKKEKEFKSYKDQFIHNGQKKLGVTAKYMEEFWGQIESWAGYGFNLSHAVSYSYLSARQLYLKSHYPLEFYTSVLICEEDQTKIKAYKTDANKHGIEVMGLDLNKSKVDFTIGEDNKIYFGFRKIKGIGAEIAQKIVDNQPYTSFVDFLIKFGFDLKVVKPLLALGLFDGEYDRVTLFKFFEYLKVQQSKNKGRVKRQEIAQEKFKAQLEDILIQYLPNPDWFGELNQFDNPIIEERWEEIFGNMEIEEPYNYKGDVRLKKTTVLKKIEAVVRKRSSSMNSFENRESDYDASQISMKDFNPALISIDQDTQILLENIKLAETEFYGFTWVHDLEENEFYSGLTFEDFETSNKSTGNVEVHVLKVQSKTSKKGTTYKSMQVEDATGKLAWITVWQDDAERFADEFKAGNLLRIRIQKPFGNFPSYSFDSPKKHERRFLPKDKDQDYRVFVMKVKEVKKQSTKKVKEKSFEIL